MSWEDITELYKEGYDIGSRRRRAVWDIGQVIIIIASINRGRKKAKIF